jgi:hypothetical protein
VGLHHALQSLRRGFTHHCAQTTTVNVAKLLTSGWQSFTDTGSDENIICRGEEAAQKGMVGE